jgi:tRNA threonylcarbamoyladenosine biosynthesis protein TsaB
MKILALEFSTRHRCAAVLDTSGCAEASRGVARETDTRATPVFSLIERALAQAGLAREDIEAIAVGLGPGSATGIRAAIAVAQGWHLARGVRLLGLGSLEVLAAELHAEGRRGRVWLAVDAQRGEFHLARYELETAGPRLIEPLRLASRGEVIAAVQAGEAVLGPDLAALVAGASDAFPEAEALARLAMGTEVAGRPEALEPIHLRAVSFVKSPTPVRSAG